MAIATIAFAAVALTSSFNAVVDAVTADEIMPFVRDKSALSQQAVLKQKDGVIYPHYSDPSNTEWEFSPAKDWVSGFFPGQLWYLSDWQDATGNRKQATATESFIADTLFTPELAYQADRKDTHDVGFKILLSYGMGYQRNPKKTEWRDITLKGADSLMTRFDRTVGAIRSWDYKQYGDFPVITDNLMNTEILFWATEETGVKKYAEAAKSHLDVTWRDFQNGNDGCLWHRVNYDPKTGKPLVEYGTPQGVNDKDSVWARGQGWVVYGYTMAYRYTKDKNYLNYARMAGKCFVDELKRLNIKDYVPPFDFRATGEEAKLQDSSATAIVASAFAELGQWGSWQGIDFTKTSKNMVTSLYQNYRATKPTQPFILLHGESHLQKGIHDRALIYGDYYFVEAVMRLAGYAEYM